MAKVTAKKAVKPKKTAVKKAKATPKKAATKAKPTPKKKPKTATKKSDVLSRLKPSEIYCAFCDNSPKDCHALLCSTTHVFICDECMNEFNQVLFKQDKEYWGTKLLDILKQELEKKPVNKKSKKVKS